jgi:hypothetical protein
LLAKSDTSSSRARACEWKRSRLVCRWHFWKNFYFVVPSLSLFKSSFKIKPAKILVELEFMSQVPCFINGACISSTKIGMLITMTSDISFSAVIWILVLTYVSSVLLLLMASYMCLEMLCTRDTHVTHKAVSKVFFLRRIQHFWFQNRRSYYKLH